MRNADRATRNSRLPSVRTAAGSTRRPRRPSFRPPSPAAVRGGLVEYLLLEDAGRELAESLDLVSTYFDWIEWRRKHARTIAAVLALLPDCPARRRLEAMAREKKRRLDPKRPQPRPF